MNRSFKKINELEPPSQLEGVILRRIGQEKSKQVKKRLILSYFGLLASTTAFFYTVPVFGNSLMKSEFWDMAHLAFSDIMIVAKNWNDFSLSLLETFPTVNIIAILLPIFTLLLSFSLYLDLDNKGNHKYI